MDTIRQSTDSSWLIERQAILQHARMLLIKVGSAVLADQTGLNSQILHNLAEQIAKIGEALQGQRRIVLVSSAAVAAGKAVLRTQHKEIDFKGLSTRQAVAAIGQCQLMRAWENALQPHGLLTAQVLLTREDLRAGSRYLNVRNTFAELLEWQVLPIVNENDTVSVQELKFGDNDSLSSLLVNLLDADLFVNLTSAPGVYAEDPQKNPDASILSHIDNVAALDLNKICGGKSSVGTGGMYSKLRAARRAAQIGVPTLILPGKEPNILIRAFCSDEVVGTWISVAKNIIPRRKFRLAYQNEPTGTIFIDAGAAEALQHKGSSLLPGGITGTEGNFQQGALVRVAHAGQSLGVGLTNYSAGEIAKIMGRARHEVAAILGNAHYKDVIHRDNLLLDAAL